MSPVRIHRQRMKGWRMPEGAVYVGRPTKWGNPFVVHAEEIVVHADGRDWWCPAEHGGARVGAVDLFYAAVHPAASRGSEPDYPLVADMERELRGRDLACWCPLDQPCHADVLLELANREDADQTRSCQVEHP